MIKIIDVDIDHTRLKNEFFTLNIDKLLESSKNNQISIQCDKNSPKEKQLFESCGSLWVDMSDINNPKLKENDFVAVDFSTVYNHNTNAITILHNLKHKEPVVFGKSYQGQEHIIGLNFEQTYFVNVISDYEFQLALDLDLTKIATPVLSRTTDLTFRLFRSVSEYRFNTICDYLRSTYIEEVLNRIQKIYPIYRTRFMLSNPKTSLSWHRDLSKRIHIPIYTNDNCFMVIEDGIFRLPVNYTYLVDTTCYHTAVNASSSTRVHLVACL